MKIAIKINGDIEIEFHIFSTQRSSSMAQAILHFLLLRIFFRMTKEGIWEFYELFADAVV